MSELRKVIEKVLQENELGFFHTDDKMIKVDPYGLLERAILHRWPELGWECKAVDEYPQDFNHPKGLRIVTYQTEHDYWDSNSDKCEACGHRREVEK